MKNMGQDMQIALCVCMYNQDRTMLQNTLNGIGQNIAELYKQGVDPDKIVVVIIQDGIQKMNPSILSFFEILQKESGINFTDQQVTQEEIYSQIKKLKQKEKTYRTRDVDKIVDLYLLLFSPEQKKKRKALQFINVKKQYDKVCNTLKQVNILMNKKNITPQNLTGQIYQTYLDECYSQYIKSAPQMNLPMDNKTASEQIISQVERIYNHEPKKYKPMIQNALTKSRQMTKQYIESRQDLAHVSFFRTSQFFPDDSDFGNEKRYQNIQNRPDKKQKRKQMNQKEKEMKKKGEKYQMNQSQGDFQQSYTQEQLNKFQVDQRQTFEWKKNKDIYSIKMNIFFVIKYRNAQKLSSHNWFFNGFCKQFSDWQVRTQGNTKIWKRERTSPKYTILLDVGLKPAQNALVKMYNVMQNQKQVGGVCGYMGLKIQRADPNEIQDRQNLDFISRLVLNFVDIQRAQQLEYHFSHLIDKGFQSIFKFIHVLPGAYSGYNMKAIWGEKSESSDADTLLTNYFSAIGQSLKYKTYAQTNLSFWSVVGRVILPSYLVKKCFTNSDSQTYEDLMYESNVNLAEDRILCMGIHKNGKQLIFLPDAHSLVDPVKDLPSMMGQRKRWINGSFFAFQKVSKQFSKLGFQPIDIQILYLSIMNLLAYIAPGFFLFTVSVAMQAFKADMLVRVFDDTLKSDNQIYGAFVYTINFIYAMLIGGLVYFSMNLDNKNPKFVRYSYSVSTILGFMSFIIMIILIVDLVRGLTTTTSSYLIDSSSPMFTESIPGGQQTVNILRYVLLGTLGLYAAPILLYSIFFCHFRIIPQILAGTFSFIFYQPTYLILLNVYALCRMNDLSWGTKGIDGSSNQNTEVQNTWKIIRTINVAKFVFWNVIVAGLLIHFGSNYLVRFYLTFGLMIIISGTMLIKVSLSIAYYLYYLVCIKTSKKQPQTPLTQKQLENSKIPALFRRLYTKVQNGDSTFYQLILQQIKNNMYKLEEIRKKKQRQSRNDTNELIKGLFQFSLHNLQRMSVIRTKQISEIHPTIQQQQITTQSKIRKLQPMKNFKRKINI